MEQKINALKTASKVISVITKIGYSVMVVMMSICAAMLIFLGVTGGENSMFTIGKTNIIVFDEIASTPAELVALCCVLIVTSALFFTIYLLSYGMFKEISLTGDPFTEKYGKVIRIIGIIVAVMPIAIGLTEMIVSFFTKTELSDTLSDIPSVVVGAIIFCLSYIIDYGCAIAHKKI